MTCPECGKRRWFVLIGYFHFCQPTPRRDEPTQWTGQRISIDEITNGKDLTP